MHKFALFFMLTLIASAIAVLSEPVFAQEMTTDATQEITNGTTATDEATGEDAADDSSDDTETTDDSSDDTETTDDSSDSEETDIDSPLEQMSMGVDPHQIQCNPEYKLVFKASNWNPACVKESSFQTLSAWGWIANHDPSEEDLTKMIADHMAKYPPEQDTETEQENETQMEENMDVNDDSSTNSTSTDAPEPQSHTINLSENMDMGAQ